MAAGRGKFAVRAVLEAKGGFEAVSNRADMLSDNLLALGAQYGWQLAGMMLMGAALMRSGWLKAGSSAFTTIGVPACC